MKQGQALLQSSSPMFVGEGRFSTKTYQQAAPIVPLADLVPA